MIDKEIGIQFVLIDLIDGVVAGLKGLQGHNVGHVHILGYTNDPLYLQGENRLLMFLVLWKQFCSLLKNTNKTRQRKKCVDKTLDKVWNLSGGVSPPAPARWQL